MTRVMNDIEAIGSLLRDDGYVYSKLLLQMRRLPCVQAADRSIWTQT